MQDKSKGRLLSCSRHHAARLDTPIKAPDCNAGGDTTTTIFKEAINEMSMLIFLHCVDDAAILTFV